MCITAPFFTLAIKKNFSIIYNLLSNKLRSIQKYSGQTLSGDNFNSYALWDGFCRIPSRCNKLVIDIIYRSPSRPFRHRNVIDKLAAHSECQPFARTVSPSIYDKLFDVIIVFTSLEKPLFDFTFRKSLQRWFKQIFRQLFLKRRPQELIEFRKPVLICFSQESLLIAPFILFALSVWLRTWFFSTFYALRQCGRRPVSTDITSTGGEGFQRARRDVLSKPVN